MSAEQLHAKVPGLNLFYREVFEEYQYQLDQARELECRLTTGQSATGPVRWNVHQRLKKYAELTRLMFKLLQAQAETIGSQRDVLDQLIGGAGERAHKRWTPQEDEILVDLACEDDMTLVNLALTFNRTPGAISSRLTYLVGVSKVSRMVAGRLIGYLDGEPVDGHFEGRLAGEVRL